MATTDAVLYNDQTKVTTPGGGQGTWGGRENFNTWDEGRDALIQFLKDIQQLMAFLVQDRIPAESRELFAECLADANAQIDAVIKLLERVGTEQDPTYTKLHAAGLTGRPLRLKLREFYRLIKTGPVEAVLGMVDLILGSLTEAFPPLGLVKEFKETLETRLKHGGDDGIITLNLGGNEKWWEKR